MCIRDRSKSEAGDANRSTLEELLRGNVAGLPEIVEPAQSQTLSLIHISLKHVTRYTYDQTGSLLIQNVGDGQTVESSYNDIGMVTEVSGAEGSITYQYEIR